MKKGTRSDQVKDLQQKLAAYFNEEISVDGIFGSVTESYVKRFQKSAGIKVDGIAGIYTMQVLSNSTKSKQLLQNYFQLAPKNAQRFVAFIDAGHGGIDDKGWYTTGRSKYANHTQADACHLPPSKSSPSTKIHYVGTNEGTYYEGFENRVVAEMAIEELTKHGIMCIRTYHPFKDTPLEQRVELVRAWLRRGYYGYLHSFHSNAISMSNSKEKLENTRGFAGFTTRGNNLSDIFMQYYYDEIKREFGDEWVIRERNSDGDSDYEANFKVLRDTNLKEFDNRFGAGLGEFGFHTSSIDTAFIIKNRARRVKCVVNMFLKIKQYFEQNQGILG